MSRLILQGDLQQNFGEYYPIPYIDKVYIEDKNSQELSVEIHYSFLFNLPANIRNDKLRENMQIISDTLENFHFYMLLARTPSKLGDQGALIDKFKFAPGYANKEDEPFGMKFTSLNSVDNPYNALDVLSFNSSLLFDILKSIDKSGPLGDSKIIDIDEKVLLHNLNAGKYINFTTDGVNRVVKISGRVRESIHNMMLPFSGQKYVGSAGDLSLLAFTSLKSIDELFNPKNRHKMTTSRANSLWFSDVAYEKLLVSDGDAVDPTMTVPNQIQIKYFDSFEELYNDVPLMSTNGTYHKSIPELRPEIIQKFNSVLDSYAPEAEVESENSPRPGVLQESINSVRFALATSNSITILPEIQKARRIIPERSTGTYAGQLYEDLGTLLTRANAVVERQPQVFKRLVTNSKIVDRRQNQKLYDLPDKNLVAQQKRSGSDLLQNFFIDRKIVQTNQPSTRISFADFDVAADTRFESYVDGLGADEFKSYEDEDLLMLQLPNGKIYSLDDPEYEGLLNDNYFAAEEYNVSFGYFLFDYDTAIRKNSYIANIFNVDRVIDYFGMPFLQAYYQPIEVRLHKYRPTMSLKLPSPKPIMTFVTPLSWVDDKKTGTNEYHPGGPHPKAHGHIHRWGTNFENGAPHQVYPEKIALKSKFPRPPKNENLTKIIQNLKDATKKGDAELIKKYAFMARTTAMDDEAQQKKYAESLKNPIIVNSYLAQRALHVVNQNLLKDTVGNDLSYIYGESINRDYVNNGYRLMAFEFQNIDQFATLDEYENKVNDMYKVEIDIADGTRQCVLAIMQNFYNNMKIFKEEYLDFADEFCSFNNIDNHFNDFFKTAINQRYADDPARAPWVYCVCMYVRHLEFLTDKYQGNSADQLLEARDLLQRIAPETGTLEHVEAFYAMLEQTFEDFYGRNSKIGKYLQGSEKELDGNGTKGMFEPIIYDVSYSATHQSYIRSAFCVDDRNEFLSLINDERTRYLEAEQEYNDAVFRASLPPLEKEPQTVDTDCRVTSFGCGGGGAIGAPGIKTPGMQSFEYPGAKKCSGKVLKDGVCVCPDMEAENDEGICVKKYSLQQKEKDTSGTAPLVKKESEYESGTGITLLEIPAAAGVGYTTEHGERGGLTEAQIDYEAGRMKKRSEYHKSNKDDCQYVKSIFRSSGGYDYHEYYWMKPKGIDSKSSKYDIGKYGMPSNRALRKRKIQCDGGKPLKPKTKKCRCYSEIRPGGTWQKESKSSSDVKAVIRASGRFGGS